VSIGRYHFLLQLVDRLHAIFPREANEQPIVEAHEQSRVITRDRVPEGILVPSQKFYVVLPSEVPERLRCNVFKIERSQRREWQEIATSLVGPFSREIYGYRALSRRLPVRALCR